MPAQGVESPYPESTARVISEVCGARSDALLAAATRRDRSIKRSRGLGCPTAAWATEIGINFIHTRSMQPFACCRKFKIPFVVELETVACRSVGARSDYFVKSGLSL
jgi:hypothetical protein